MFRRIRRSALFTLSTSVLALDASAQSGGFTPGDLYFAIAGVQAPFPDGGGGIARVDPTTGTVSVLLDLPTGTMPIVCRRPTPAEPARAAACCRPTSTRGSRAATTRR